MNDNPKNNRILIIQKVALYIAEEFDWTRNGKKFINDFARH